MRPFSLVLMSLVPVSLQPGCARIPAAPGPAQAALRQWRNMPVAIARQFAILTGKTV